MILVKRLYATPIIVSPLIPALERPGYNQGPLRGPTRPKNTLALGVDAGTPKRKLPRFYDYFYIEKSEIHYINDLEGSLNASSRFHLSLFDLPLFYWYKSGTDYKKLTSNPKRMHA
jgi:hypothetical protein